MIARSYGITERAIRNVIGEGEILDYNYYYNMVNRDAENDRYLLSMPKDARTYESHIDTHGTSYYHAYGIDGFRVLDKQVRLLQKPIAPFAYVGCGDGVQDKYPNIHPAYFRAFTLNAASALLEINGSIEEILSTLRTERKRPEKIARIKAAQRMQLHDSGGWTLATSQLSSFQASAARALIGLGADASIVSGSAKGELRASLRSTDRFYKSTRIHLGEVAQALGEEFGGAGSGHPTAAGVNAEGEAELFLERAVQLISEQLE